MSAKTTKKGGTKKRGPKRKRLNYDKIGQLASFGCTDSEIASFFDMSAKTFQRRKKDTPKLLTVLDKGRNSLNIRLRQAQIKVAMDGNVAMLIFLGKNMLGQTDSQEIKHDVGLDEIASVLERAYSVTDSIPE